MKPLKAIILTVFVFSFLAFKNAPDPDFIGTYGISKNDPAKLALTINADNTFSYLDLADPNNQINAHGTWELKNNRILLHNKSENFPYGTKWKIEKDGKAVKTRNGLEFIRLAKL